MKIPNFRVELENMQRHCVRSKFSQVSKEDLVAQGLVLFGAGAHGRLIHTIFAAQGIIPEWVIDRDPKLEGTKLNGTLIRGLDSLSEVNNHFVMLGSCHIKSMIENCRAFGVDTWILPLTVGNFVHINGDLGCREFAENDFEDILSVYTLLADEKSQAIFRDYLRYNYLFDETLFRHYEPELYFPNDISKLMDYRVFVDAGAYTGDTIKDWLQYNSTSHADGDYQYYAFEPCAEQFMQLSGYVSTLPESVQNNIHLYKAALGDKEENLAMVGSGIAASVRKYFGSTDAELIVQSKCIDSIFSTICPTFIKADVEGYEAQLLLGAAETIKRCRPSLAMSIYHRYGDIWNIPKFLHQLNPRYHFYLRHHHTAFADTVCYAVSE